MNHAIYVSCLVTMVICMGGQSHSGPPYKIDDTGVDPNDLLKNNPGELHFDL